MTVDQRPSFTSTSLTETVQRQIDLDTKIGELRKARWARWNASVSEAPEDLRWILEETGSQPEHPLSITFSNDIHSTDSFDIFSYAPDNPHNNSRIFILMTWPYAGQEKLMQANIESDAGVRKKTGKFIHTSSTEFLGSSPIDRVMLALNSPGFNQFQESLLLGIAGLPFEKTE